MVKTVQAKHITDDQVLAIIRANRKVGGHTALWMISDALDPIPWKVVRAKVASMMKRKVIEGCPCGCGSPMWELDGDGKCIYK